MIQLIDGKYYIDYNDFKYLLDSGGWDLSAGMKDNWYVQNHIDHISCLINTQANLKVNFVIDNNNLNQATRIDVFIISNRQDAITKHIQFVKT